MLVEPVSEMPVPAYAPNLTVTPATKLEPAMVTTVPPLVTPVPGATPVMTGGVGVTKPPTASA